MSMRFTLKAFLLDGMLLFISTVLLYSLFMAPNGLRLYWKVKKLSESQSRQLEHIRDEKAAILRDKVLLENDEEYFDQQARVLWGFVKPGETLYWYKQQEKSE